MDVAASSLNAAVYCACRFAVAIIPPGWHNRHNQVFTRDST